MCHKMTSFVTLFCIKLCKDTPFLANKQLYDGKIFIIQPYFYDWIQNHPNKSSLCSPWGRGLG